MLRATLAAGSRLAIDLALRFGGEVINSDKMQVYQGLDVATNKVSLDLDIVDGVVLPQLEPDVHTDSGDDSTTTDNRLVIYSHLCVKYILGFLWLLL